jgi:hypothetical protein
VRFPKLESVTVDLMALEALSDGDASRLAAGLAAATGGLEVLFLGYSYSRRRPPAPGTAAARLAQLLSAAGGGGRLRSVVLAGEAHLDPPYYGGEKSGRDPIWPAALAALPHRRARRPRWRPACGRWTCRSCPAAPAASSTRERRSSASRRGWPRPSPRSPRCAPSA